ncbi:unnamed protein product [Closterium sp. NIES-54]
MPVAAPVDAITCQSYIALPACYERGLHFPCAALRYLRAPCLRCPRCLSRHRRLSHPPFLRRPRSLPCARCPALPCPAWPPPALSCPAWPLQALPCTLPSAALPCLTATSAALHAAHTVSSPRAALHDAPHTLPCPSLSSRGPLLPCLHVLLCRPATPCPTYCPAPPARALPAAAAIAAIAAIATAYYGCY